jgi:hypothetical protein
MNAMFAKLLSQDQSDWDLLLDSVVLAYNSSVNRSTGFSPNRLMYCRDVLTPLDLTLPSLRKHVKSRPVSYNDYVDKLHKTMVEMYEAARAKSAKAANARKTIYDRSVKQIQFKIGDLVFLRREPQKKGLCRKWFRKYQGPFKVIRCLSPVIYVIRRVPCGIERTVHVDRLKAFSGHVPVMQRTSIADDGYQEMVCEPVRRSKRKCARRRDRTTL